VEGVERERLVKQVMNDEVALDRMNGAILVHGLTYYLKIPKSTQQKNLRAS
jgi:hypothetical protein